METFFSGGSEFSDGNTDLEGTGGGCGLPAVFISSPGLASDTGILLGVAPDGEAKLLGTVGFFAISSNWDRKVESGTLFLDGSDGFSGGPSEKSVALVKAFPDVARNGSDGASKAAEAESASLFGGEYVFTGFGPDKPDGDFVFCRFAPFFFWEFFRALLVGGETMLLGFAGSVSVAIARSEVEGGVISLDDNVPEGVTAEAFCSGFAAER
jgi:hypothetical protein